jgi:thiamine-monophosphate kinase
VRETTLIDWIGRLADSGIGDDCAVWRPAGSARNDLLFTTDQLIEGVHYTKDRLPARKAGARLMGRGLSDIAAMGGVPKLAFLSLALPSKTGQSWRLAFLRGFGAEARRFGVAWAGGDLSGTSGPAVAAITVVGEVPRGSAILRSGARLGDRLYVTGILGRASSTVTPRLEAGQYLRRRKLATSMIDISDGLSTDLGHLAKESRVGAVVKAELIPKAGALGKALHWGEDYELLFTARGGTRIPAKIAGVPVREIGYITTGRRVVLEHSDGHREQLEPRGWEHF